MAREPREILIFLGINLISYRLRSRKEIFEYLTKMAKKKEYPPHIAEEVTNRLEEMGYVNDQKFAEAWVDGRRRGKKKGILALQMELKAKGVPQHIIHAVLGTRDVEEERMLAQSAVAKKVQNWSKLPVLLCKKKVYDYLTRRGFSSSITLSLVDEVCSKSYNTSSEI